MFLEYRIEKCGFAEVMDFCLTLKADSPYFLENVEINDYVKKISEKSTFVTCRNDEGRIVGFLSFYMNNSDFAFITLVGVLKDYRRNGIFSKMLFLLEAKCVCQEYDQVRLEVANANLGAFEAYRKSGFETFSKFENSMIMFKFIKHKETYV